jgi:hypothetical protein
VYLERILFFVVVVDLMLQSLNNWENLPMFWILDDIMAIPIFLDMKMVLWL